MQGIILPLDVWNEIFNKLDLISQLNLNSTCKYFRRNLNVLDLENVDSKIKRCISNEVLLKMRNLRLLDLSFCLKSFFSLNHLSKLEFLALAPNSVEDKEISALVNLTYLEIPSNYNVKTLTHLTKLKSLNLSRNPITNINFLTNLKSLTLRHYGGLTEEGMEKLTQLKKLNISHNKDIKVISHFTNLVSLDIRGIDLHDNQITPLTNLTKLVLGYSYFIIKINHLTKLKILNIECKSDFNNESIECLTNLEQLIIFGSSNIRKIKHLTGLTRLKTTNCFFENEQFKALSNLKVLDMRDYRKHIDFGHIDINDLIRLEKLIIYDSNFIADEHITALTNLLELDISNGSHHITDINHCIRLTKLSAKFECGLQNNGIKNLTKLKYLELSGNTKITDINHLVELQYLNIRFDSAISDRHITNLTNLKELDCSGNLKIVNVSNLKNLKKLDVKYPL